MFCWHFWRTGAWTTDDRPRFRCRECWAKKWRKS